jgi:hypothetical protein
MVRITMPKKLMNDINRGYSNLDKNKVEDILSQNGAVNYQADETEQQVQDITNAEQPEA